MLLTNDIEFAFDVCYSPGRYGWMIHGEYDTEAEAEAEIERLKPLHPEKEFWVYKTQVKPYRSEGWFFYPLAESNV